MNRWTPITTVAELPPIDADESEYWEFKGEPWTNSDADTLELARDVAQFANHLGGSIIVGAVRHPTHRRLQRYASIANAETVAQRICDVCYERLSPRRTDLACVVLTTAEGHRVVVANVPASVGPTAIRVSKKGKTRWEFYRRYEQSKQQIEFEEVEKMWSEGRRGRILLAKIPEEHWNDIHLDLVQSFPLQACKLTVAADYFSIQVPHGEIFNLPFEFVRAVWPHRRSGWTIALAIKIRSQSHPSGAVEMIASYTP